MPYLIIEHLEDISEWLWLEYSHVAEWWKDKLVFTNVRGDERKRLAKLGSVVTESVTRFPFNRSKLIVLDLQAGEKLKPEDVEEDTMIVVGGILGDAVPRGRTKKFITSRMKGVKVRHIGKPQYSIDGASIVARLIADGKRLEEIEYEENPTIRLDEFSEITLHYAVPKLDGRLLLTPGLIELQRGELGYTGADDEISDEELVEFFEGRREL
ncbi:hypothetical protein [Thermococcus sp.]|uniref:hypothetical protein n=1 Tax=Thermococcus sp. TaxID=35749 RepID=UPI0026363089|nr:hypothetical protein [Thermococcus sp.]